jgi:hypothetical protein
MLIWWSNALQQIHNFHSFDFLFYYWILFVPNSLAEFEKHTFDITALEYGAEAKKAAEG